MEILDVAKGLRIEKIYAAGIFHNEIPYGFLSGFYDRFEVVFVNSGKLIIASGGKVYECSAGTAALFRSGEIHYVKTLQDEYTEYFFVSFSGSGEDVLNFKNSVTTLTVFQKQLIMNACNQLSVNGEYNIVLPSVLVENLPSLKLKATIEILLIDITTNDGKVSAIESRDSLLFEKACSEMQRKVKGQLSLEELANTLEISLSHLKRIFALFCNVGAHEYYMQLKIIASKQMLKDGVSVTETADIMGFNNQNYFSAAFKRIVGVSPKEYCTVKKKTTVKTVNNIKKTTTANKGRPASDMPSYLL